MRNRLAIGLVGCFAAMFFFSCKGRVVYSEASTLPRSGWHADSVLTYRFDIQDTTAYYDVLLYVRHTQQYPYQNMWLFVGTDTIEFYLADQRGRWLGNGWGELREMPVIYRHNIQFPRSGEYVYIIRQAMRDTVLTGVSDVGITIEKNNGQE